jgi:precorrin isomerase
MANIFFTGEKATKQDAIESVTELVKNYCDCVVDAKVVNDDGGHILQVMVEVLEPSKPVLEQKEDFPLLEIIPKWKGWRAVVIKVPIGYINTVVKSGGDD